MTSMSRLNAVGYSLLLCTNRTIIDYAAGLWQRRPQAVRGNISLTLQQWKLLTSHIQGWSVPKYPLIVGHEIVGTATRVGSAVTSIKVGDRVGVGAQIGACNSCEPCTTGNENYCLGGLVDTYDAFWPDGTRTMGGYSNYIRSTEKFTFKIPDGLESELAAPMLCAGLTVYSPMKRKGVGSGKKVGIVGIGGLGHFGIMFAAAMGAEVYAISHSPSKEADARKVRCSILHGPKDTRS
jgi:alcohol dehydrogenase (NADP+)